MAQVYTFTDANGEIRLMAEINPAPGGSQPFVGACIRLGSTVTDHQSGTVPFDTTDFDSGGVADLANNRLVVPVGKGGIWEFGCSLKGNLNGSVTGADGDLSTSGNAPNGYVPIALSGGGGAAYGSGVIEQAYAAGDTVELIVVVNGGGLDLIGFGNGCVLYCHRLGDAP